MTENQHTPVTLTELGHSRNVCGTCGCDWPCPPAVMRVCENQHLAHGLPCNCGHHAEAEEGHNDRGA